MVICLTPYFLQKTLLSKPKQRLALLQYPVSLRRQFTSLLWLSTRCAGGSPTTACWHLAAHEGLMFPSGSRLGLFHFVLTEKCYLSEQLQARRHPSCRHEAVVALKRSAVLRGLRGLQGWAVGAASQGKSLPLPEPCFETDSAIQSPCRACPRGRKGAESELARA